MVKRRFPSAPLKRQVKEGKASISEVLRSGGGTTKRSYAIQDPSERMVAIVGASLFNEPKYYPVNPQERKDSNGKLAGYHYHDEDLNDHARLVLNTAMEIAESENPEDLVKIAHWARTELKLRTTPQILLAVAAHFPATKGLVREYCSKVIRRADDIKQVFAAYRHLFGHNQMLPSCLKRGLADAFTQFNDAQFLKYNSKDRPTFGDILKMVDRKKDWPLKKSLDHYLKSGEVIEPETIPVIAARKKLMQQEYFDTEAQKLAKESRANWEVLKSAFPGDGRKVWEWLIENNQLPYMAMLRNLRNLIDEKVSSKHITRVCKRLEEGAVQSKQLPFRFLAAKNAILGEEAGDYWQSRYFSKDKSKTQSKDQERLIKAIHKAVDSVVESLPKIPGKTLVAVDTSGSMWAPVSGRSKITCVSAASMLGAMAAKLCETGSVIGAFADRFRTLPMPIAADDTTMEIAKRIEETEAGGGTCAEDVLAWALKNKKITFDRIIILSDMQTYNSSGVYYRRANTIKGLISEYRRTRNAKCALHCFDLRGDGTSRTPEGDPNTNLVAGFSEQILKQVIEFEGLTNEEDEEDKQVFTIEYIRENF